MFSPLLYQLSYLGLFEGIPETRPTRACAGKALAYRKSALPCRGGLVDADLWRQDVARDILEERIVRLEDVGVAVIDRGPLRDVEHDAAYGVNTASSLSTCSPSISASYQL